MCTSQLWLVCAGFLWPNCNPYDTLAIFINESTARGAIASVLGEIHVRPATLADVPGINRVHTGDTDPWADIAEAAIWVNHRLLRGFHVDVATVGGEVLGHAEWIKNHNPEGKFLYLGILQVHPKYRRLGVGKAMLEAGFAEAQALGCPELQTIPDEEAYEFYARCGFALQRGIQQYNLACIPMGLPPGWVETRTVPQQVIHTLPFRLGWAGQACSAHMWEVCNKPVLVAGDVQRYLTAKHHGGDAYVQLRYTGGKTVLAVAWAAASISRHELTDVVMALATKIPVRAVCISYPEESRPTEQVPGSAESLPGLEVWSKPVAS